MTQLDYATDKLVSDGLEERVCPEREVILVEDYGYRKDQIDISVPIRRGSSIVGEADIVVYADASARL